VQNLPLRQSPKCSHAYMMELVCLALPTAGMLVLGKSRQTAFSLAGFYLCRIQPRGTAFYSDIKLSLPNFQPKVVFDVGANIGQNTAEYLKAFPEAAIYAFEPVAATFGKLKERFKQKPRVQTEQLALSNRAGEAKMHVAESSVRSRISANGSEVV